MRVGITVGQIGDKFKVLALPDQHIQKQRNLVKQIQIARGQFENEQLDRVMMFESPAVKDKRFLKARMKREAEQSVSKKATKAKG